MIDQNKLRNAIFNYTGTCMGNKELSRFIISVLESAEVNISDKDKKKIKDSVKNYSYYPFGALGEYFASFMLPRIKEYKHIGHTLLKTVNGSAKTNLEQKKVYNYLSVIYQD